MVNANLDILKLGAVIITKLPVTRHPSDLAFLTLTTMTKMTYLLNGLCVINLGRLRSVRVSHVGGPRLPLTTKRFSIISKH